MDTFIIAAFTMLIIGILFNIGSEDSSVYQRFGGILMVIACILIGILSVIS